MSKFILLFIAFAGVMYFFHIDFHSLVDSLGIPELLKSIF